MICRIKSICAFVVMIFYLRHSTSGGFRLGPGGHRPPNLAQPAPKFLIGSRGVLGVYTRVYAVYQPLVFLTANNYLICHNKTG